jgi:hypothetical protein
MWRCGVVDDGRSRRRAQQVHPAASSTSALNSGALRFLQAEELILSRIEFFPLFPNPFNLLVLKLSTVPILLLFYSLFFSS